MDINVPRWAMAYVPPMQRFYPMPEGTLHAVIEVAREEEIRLELVDRDWGLSDQLEDCT